MIQVYACSSNPGKLREFALVSSEIGATDVVLTTLPGLKQIETPDETGNTFEGNASEKAIYYSRFTDGIVLADDSGIEVEALGNAPGVYSARYAGPEATDEMNNRFLLEQMRDEVNRAARFVSVIALAQDGKILGVFRGTVEGELLHAPRGENGFGYDPLFFYRPFQCSFGEVDGSRKFGVSHRGSALRQAVDWLARHV